LAVRDCGRHSIVRPDERLGRDIDREKKYLAKVVGPTGWSKRGIVELKLGASHEFSRNIQSCLDQEPCCMAFEGHVQAQFISSPR
jgi:hypothetical protein